jgi:thiol-disulfide isomerase/thioredoxin
MRKVAIMVLMLLAFNSASAGTVCIYYFWQTGCGACARIEPYLDQFESTYDVEIHKFELHSWDAWQVLYQIDEHYGKDFSVDRMWTPTFFIGDHMLVNPSPAELESYIQSNLESGCACPNEEQCNITHGNYTNGNYTNGIVLATMPLNPIVIMVAAVTLVVVMAVIGLKIKL